MDVPVNARTRIKICGITTPDDARTAVAAGADAIGLVFHRPSARNLDPAQARAIALAAAPFVTRVALFVDPDPTFVATVLAQAPIDCLQFHGDEPPAFCRRFGRPYLKAARVRPSLDLLEYLVGYDDASGWLLDSFRADMAGGTGAPFDWRAVPARLARPLVLSGGLDAANVGRAIRSLRPFAVDVSSGVESAPGVKDAMRIAQFVAAVRAAEVIER